MWMSGFQLRISKIDTSCRWLWHYPLLWYSVGRGWGPESAVGFYTLQPFFKEKKKKKNVKKKKTSLLTTFEQTYRTELRRWECGGGGAVGRCALRIGSPPLTRGRRGWQLEGGMHMDGTGGNQMGWQRRLWGNEGEWGRVWHAPHPSSSAPPPSNPRRHGDQSVVPSCIFDDGRTQQGAGATSGAERRHRHRVLLASRLDLTIGSGRMGRHLGCFLAAIWTAKFFSFLTFTPLSDKTGCRPQRLPGGLEKSPPSYRERLFVICPRLPNPQKLP